MKSELLDELCRRFDSKPDAMLMAMRHGAVTIDGYIIRPQHLDRWTRAQLIGRYVTLFGRRVAQLYGSTQVRG